MKKLLKVLSGIIIILVFIWFAGFQIYVTKSYYGGWYVISSKVGIISNNNHSNFSYKPSKDEIKKAKEYVYNKSKIRREFKYGF